MDSSRDAGDGAFPKSVEDIAARLLRGITSMRTQSTWMKRIGRVLAHLRPKIEFDPASGQPGVTLSPEMRLAPSGLDAVFDLIEEMGKDHRLAVALEIVYGPESAYKFFDPFLKQWILHRF